MNTTAVYDENGAHEVGNFKMTYKEKFKIYIKESKRIISIISKFTALRCDLFLFKMDMRWRKQWFKGEKSVRHVGRRRGMAVNWLRIE